MGTGEPCVTVEVAEEESALLVSVIRRFEAGVTEGQFHTLIYVGQKLGLASTRYEFNFQQFWPFSEELDLKIAMLIWNNSVLIRDNRIRAAAPAAGSSVPPGVGPASLDKLADLSYDSLKFLAAVLHLERDLGKTRPESTAAALKMFPIQEDQGRNLLQLCGAQPH